MRSKSWLVAIIVLAAMLAACGGNASRELETYYLVVFSKAEPYFQDAQSGLARAASELGVTAEMIGPDGYDPQAQKAELDRVVAQDPPPAGILVSSSDADLLTPSINAAVAQGINVITVDSDAPDSSRLSFIGTDNYDVGEMAANYITEQLDNSGGVVVYTTVGQPNLDQRLSGFSEVLGHVSGLRIIEEIDIQGDAANAAQATEELLSGSNRNRVNAIVCLQAVACSEVAEVLASSDVEDMVVLAMEADQSTLDGIRQGSIRATIAERPFTMAYLGLRQLAGLYEYRPRSMERENSLATVPEAVYTGSMLVDSRNVDAFIRNRENSQAAAQAAPAE